MTAKWCIPPIRFVQKVFVPPKNSEDWTRISYQPMLYLGTFLAALTVLIFGDFTMIAHDNGISSDRQFSLYWVWISMSLIAPPMGLGSLWLIQNREGAARYRGLVLRLAADIFQFTAMLIYMILRISWGDYHVYPVTVLGTATLFVGHLVMRDARRLIEVERLANRIHRNGKRNAR